MLYILKGGDKLGFFHNLLRLNKKGGDIEKEEFLEAEKISLTEKFDKLYTETYINYLAFYSNVNRIANAFCKCTFDTYFKNEFIKGEEWYTWNVQPNKNQSAYEFKNELITKLYEKNEALVIETAAGDLYVADSYNHDEYVLYEDIFKNVILRGVTMQKTYKQSEVLFFKLNDVNIKKLLDGISLLMKNLMSVAIESYADSKNEKVIVDIDEFAQGSTDFKKNYEKLMREDFKNYFNAKRAVLPLFKGYELNQNSRTPDFSTTPKDIIDLMNNTVEIYAKGLNVPVALAKGEVQDTSKAVDELLTFCVDPLVKMIQEEVIRKRYGLEEIDKGNYLSINSEAIKHIDIFDVATPIEKLISSACFTVNDIKRALGKPTINEEWANKYFMTKNFSTIEDLLKSLKGGEEIGKD